MLQSHLARFLTSHLAEKFHFDRASEPGNPKSLSCDDDFGSDFGLCLSLRLCHSPSSSCTAGNDSRCWGWCHRSQDEAVAAGFEEKFSFLCWVVLGQIAALRRVHIYIWMFKNKQHNFRTNLHLWIPFGDLVFCSCLFSSFVGDGWGLCLCQ